MSSHHTYIPWFPTKKERIEENGHTEEYEHLGQREARVRCEGHTAQPREEEQGKKGGGKGVKGMAQEEDEALHEGYLDEEVAQAQQSKVKENAPPTPARGGPTSARGGFVIHHPCFFAPGQR